MLEQSLPNIRFPNSPFEEKYPSLIDLLQNDLFEPCGGKLGYFWVTLGTVGRLWAKLGFVKVVFGQNSGCG